MNRFYLWATLIASCLYSIGWAQGLPVDTTQKNRNVLLEEFTGKDCTFCPDGHRIANELKSENPGRFFAYNIHAGGFATGTPDYTIPEGEIIDNFIGVSGYPAGTINRRAFGGTRELSRNEWATRSTPILDEMAEVNIGIETTISIVPREVSVEVQLYYTGDAPTATNKLNIVMIQDNIIGPQTGSSANPSSVTPSGEYIHNDMLRAMLTGQWGWEISNTTMGSRFDTTFTFAIPDSVKNIPVDLEDLSFIAFVTEDANDNVLNAEESLPTYTNAPNNLNATINDAGTPSEICGWWHSPSVTLQNNGNETLTSLAFEATINSGPPVRHEWTGLLNTLDETVVTIPDVYFLPNASITGNTIEVTITSVNGNASDDVASDNVATANFATTDNTFQEDDLTLDLTLDRFGEESSWELLDKAENFIPALEVGGSSTGSDTTYTSQSPTYPNGAANTSFSYSFQNDGYYGCYTFTFFDSFGDGFESPGEFTFRAGTSTLLTEDRNFGSRSSVIFATEDASGNSEADAGITRLTDSDDDGLTDFEELNTWRSDPNNPDTDGDGVSDGDEVAAGTDPVAINDLSVLADFAIFPNPASDNVVISLEKVSDEALSIELLNALGQVVRTVEANQGDNMLSVSNLNTGVYTVAVKANGRVVASSQVVVQ